MRPIYIKQLENHLMDMNILGAEEIEAFVKLLTFKRFKKNDFLVKAGEISHELAFVSKGIFRTYFNPSQGCSVTQCFTFENNFITAYSSFITQKESGENIQAVTNSEALVISKAGLEELSQQYAGWMNFQRKHSEQQYLQTARFFKRVYYEDAETRYVHLIQNYPHYFQHLPLNHIASYLGITQRHLSRIRRGIMLKEMENSKRDKTLITA